MNETVCVVGASGLVGGLLVHALLQEPVFEKVMVLVRKPLPLVHTKLEQHVVNFNDVAQIEAALTKGSTLFICMGTTQKKVQGNKELYKQIDVVIPSIVGKAAIAKGYTTVSLVSAVGANIQATNFYLHVKGLAENTMQQMGFSKVHIYRPSLLIGSRTEKRMVEKIAQLITPALNFLLMGGLSKYKAIPALTVAKAMCNNVLYNQQQGVQLFEYAAIKKAANLNG
jgi:uncharacterized protein YbjT (DUF2867 family)